MNGTPVLPSVGSDPLGHPARGHVGERGVERAGQHLGLAARQEHAVARGHLGDRADQVDLRPHRVNGVPGGGGGCSSESQAVSTA